MENPQSTARRSRDSSVSTHLRSLL